MDVETFIDNEVSSRSMNTYAPKIREFREYMSQKGKDINRGEYGKSDVKEYLEGYRDGLSPSSKNLYLAIIKKFAKFQIDNIYSEFSLPKVSEENPEGQEEMMKLMMERQEVEEEREETMQRLRNVRNVEPYPEMAEDQGNVLTTEQLKELLKIASKSDLPIIIAYFYFGVRKNEWPTFREVDLEENKVTFDTLKYRKKIRERTLPFDDHIAEIFRAYKNGDIKLKYSESALYKKVHRYKDELGVENLNPTTGRRSFRTHMMDILNDRPLIKHLMGHKLDEDIGDHYDVSLWEQKVRAMKKEHYMDNLGITTYLK